MTRCLASLHNLYYDTSGEVRLCCNSSENLEPQLTVDGALFSPTAIKIQTALKNGNAHPTCSTCWKEESSNVNSYRLSYNSLYPAFGDQPKLHTVHLMNDNTCNCSCVYCGPTYSSTWSQLLGQTEKHRMPITFNDSVLSSLTMITMAGGEPSIIKSNIELLTQLYAINPNCEIVVNTNLSNIDNNFFQQLFKFSNVKIIVSYETIKERYEYVRKGAQWNRFSQNFELIQDKVKTVQASMIYFPLSMIGIFDAIDYALKYIPSEEIYINDYLGNDFTWNKIGKTALDNAVDVLLKYCKSTDTGLANQLIQRSKLLISDIETTQCSQLEYFDQLTKLNHRLTFPELYYESTRTRRY